MTYPSLEAAEDKRELLARISHTIVFVFDEVGDENLPDCQPYFGLGGICTPALSLVTSVVPKWLALKRDHFGSATKALHATEVGKRLTRRKCAALQEFFLDGDFLRLFALVKRDDWQGQSGSAYAAIGAPLRRCMQWALAQMPFAASDLVVIHEHSFRGTPYLNREMGGHTVLYDGTPIPVLLKTADKEADVPALEIADFIANAAGAELRWEMSNGRAKRRPYADHAFAAPSYRFERFTPPPVDSQTM